VREKQKTDSNKMCQEVKYTFFNYYIPDFMCVKNSIKGTFLNTDPSIMNVHTKEHLSVSYSGKKD